LGKCEFSLVHLTEIFKLAVDLGYQVIPCQEYLKYKRLSGKKVLVNRVDIDYRCFEASKIAEMFNNLKIKGTFFIRLHAEEYNPFSIKNYGYLKYIKESGHELGLHCEALNISKSWNLSPESLLRKDIKFLNRMMEITIYGVASHRELQEENNLNFWKHQRPSEFGLSYHAYDSEPKFNLFNASVYVSDSLCKWNCYRNGVLDKTDTRCLCKHLRDNNRVLYTLIHPSNQVSMKRG